MENYVWAVIVLEAIVIMCNGLLMFFPEEMSVTTHGQRAVAVFGAAIMLVWGLSLQGVI